MESNNFLPKTTVPTGAQLWTPYFPGLLADQLGKAELVHEAMATISKALKHAERSGEGYSLRELHRIEHELLGQQVEHAG